MIKSGIFIISPRQKLILGLFFIPAYLLQQSIPVRSLQFVVLIIVYILQGGRFRLAPNLMLSFGIIFAYLLRPAGKLLFMFAGLPITEGALFSGLTRALMLIGLIYISRIAVSSKLNFRGRAGNLIGRVFYYFESITEGQGNFHFRNFYKPGIMRRLIEYMDDLLFSVENKDMQIEIPEVNKNTISFGPAFYLIIIFILINYIMLLPIQSYF